MKLILTPDGVFLGGKLLMEVTDIRIRMPDDKEHSIVDVVEWLEKCKGVLLDVRD